MKRISKRVGVGLLCAIFMLTLVSAMPVEAKVPLRWEYTADQTGVPLWTGEIVTGDGVVATIIFDIPDDTWKGLNNGEVWSGPWSVTWADGEYISGTQSGVLVYTTSDYVINGKITETSEGCKDLDGRHIHIMGTLDYSAWPLLKTIGIFQIN